MKSSWNEFTTSLNILYIFEKPPWNEKKTSLIPFLNLSLALTKRLVAKQKALIYEPQLSLVYPTKSDTN